jgi:hypothetical protein
MSDEYTFWHVTQIQLTPWTWALLQKPPIAQQLKNFSAFYGTRRFIIVFTSALRRSLSCARSIQSIPPHPFSLRSILILSTHLRFGLPSGLFLSGFPTNILYAFLVSNIRTYKWYEWQCNFKLSPNNFGGFYGNCSSVLHFHLILLVGWNKLDKQHKEHDRRLNPDQKMSKK